MLTKIKKGKKSALLDVLIGPIVNIFYNNNFEMRVDRIGSHNIVSYHGYETVTISDSNHKLTNELIGKNVKCKIHFRNEYNFLVADMETF